METQRNIVEWHLEAVERRGQTAAVVADILPVCVEPEGARAALEKAGVRFLGPVEGDPLFVKAELPAGWKKVPTSHHWLSMLTDEQGRERARIFYKAADYDRKAALVLTPRYGIYESCYSNEWVEEGLEQEFMVCVTDGGVVLDGRRVIFNTDVVCLTGTRREKFRATRLLIEVAKAWLNENFPDWQNPFAYWE